MATTNEKASNWWDLAQDAWLSTFATKFEACSCRLWPLLDLPVQTSLKEVKCVACSHTMPCASKNFPQKQDLCY